LGIAFLADPEAAAAEIRRKAERGFVAVALPERPHEAGLPSLWDRAHWDPILDACNETGTVVALHVGSSGMPPIPPGAPPVEISATLFGQLARTVGPEWLWS